MSVVVHNYISYRDKKSRASSRPARIAAVGRALAHVKYIRNRPGRDKEKGGREFFSEDQDGVKGRDIRAKIRELEQANVVAHKLTLAPQIEPIDKKKYTRDVMKEISAEKGQDLNWFAVEHGNTGHPHIHVVVLGKDKNGKDVRFDKRDYPKLREYGDKHLERWQPLEMDRWKREYEKNKERERAHKREKRQKQREKQRQERFREGLELPWMHKKIVREQYEPYSNWKKNERQREEERRLQKEDREKSKEKKAQKSKDKIKAAGKDWTKENTLNELNELNRYLWDNYNERIDKPQYKKLVAWIKEKEQAQEREKELPKDKQRSDQNKEPEKDKAFDKEKDYFEYQGKKYSERSPYGKLTELNKKLYEPNAERLPVEQYQKLRGWIENGDRSRWQGVLERQTEYSKKQFAKEGASQTEYGSRAPVSPVQQQMMTNPVVGLFMTGASATAELVRMIPLTDQRDRMKEAYDQMEDAKRAKHKEYVKPGQDPDKKARDKETIDKLDERLDENKKLREERDKKKKQKRDRGDDSPFKRDPWGRW